MKSWDELYASLTKRAASAQLIIEDSDGNVLVVKAHYKPYWSLPGGIIDAGETPLTTALREVQEEVGLVIDPDDVDFAATIVRQSKRAITYLFVFQWNLTVDSNVEIHIDSTEITDFAWVSKQDVVNRRLDRHYSRAVKNWAREAPLRYIESANVSSTS